MALEPLHLGALVVAQLSCDGEVELAPRRRVWGETRLLWIHRLYNNNAKLNG